MRKFFQGLMVTMAFVAITADVVVPHWNLLQYVAILFLAFIVIFVLEGANHLLELADNLKQQRPMLPHRDASEPSEGPNPPDDRFHGNH